MPDLAPADLRAAVAAGVLNEAQAADLQALAAQRLAAKPLPDDEPFELFRGFSEIFISVGLLILLAGFLGMATMLGMPVLLLVVGVVVPIVLAWYFTLKRRMVLPSIVLVTAFTISMAGLIGWFVIDKLQAIEYPRTGGLVISGLTALALIGWFRVFRLPFTMFLIGVSGFIFVLFLTNAINPAMVLQSSGWHDLFDLRGGSGLAIGTLVFGLLAAAVALAFDMRDPHRLGRWSASAFWLDLVAAPAIVNTLGLTAMGLEGGARIAALVVSLLIMALYAIIIDRRSFLSAGLGYLAWLIWQLASQNGSGLSWPQILILIGASVTALGAWWVPLRGIVMRALPDFPGKDHLPPYAKGKP